MNGPRHGIPSRVLLLVCLGIALLASPAMAEEYQDDVLMALGEKRVLADLWGLDAIGLDASFRKSLTEDGNRDRVVVAVIDSGVDDGHPDIADDSLWVNEQEPLNGRDDDGNGYVDDRYGWDFIDNDNNPWDELGHGTHVAGIIAAATGNGIGIAGVDSRAIIMPLRALNLGGRGYGSQVGAAIIYAANQGATIINLSMAIEELSPQEQRAIGYAREQGALVVAAAGNDGKSTAGYTPASIPGVLTVAATGRDHQRAPFSNFGSAVDISAPGVDIVSLRALRTNFAGLLSTNAVESSPFVGPKSSYYRASGTSFAAPFVSGAAALLKSRNKTLSATQLSRMLKNSARDIDAVGIDANTGYGLLDVKAALAADPEAYVLCQINGVSVVTQDSEPYIAVNGSTASDRLRSAELVLGEGNSPTQFSSPLFEIRTNTQNAELGRFNAQVLRSATQWTLQVNVKRKGGMERSCRYELSLG